jgi:hypothetical protein
MTVYRHTAMTRSEIVLLELKLQRQPHKLSVEMTNAFSLIQLSHPLHIYLIYIE